MKVKLLYFASLADHAGCSGELRETAATNPRDLYAEVASAHAFALAPATASSISRILRADCWPRCVPAKQWAF